MNQLQKTRVLFVDDEPNALQWLKRTLHPLGDRWDMAFAESGERALEMMAQHPWQVVVSDMRMPRMNGAELLTRLKQQYPQTVRVIISDYADRSSVMDCVGTAHQFLSKPCHPDELRTAIDRACAFNGCLKSQRIKQIIGEMECLPALPSILNEVLQHLQEETPDIDKIGQLISQDIGMTAKLLRLVNSGFFGLQSEVTHPAEAVSYLGLETIKGLMLSTQAFATYEKRDTGPVAMEALWRHSLEVADLARRIAQDVGTERATADESFIAGMLHDTGKLALAVNLPAQYESVFGAAANLGLSLHAAEEAAFGAHHGDIGGHLLSLWGLPGRVVNAITYHHEPQLDGGSDFTPTLAVHIANALRHEAADPEVEHLDSRLLADLALADSVDRWRKF